MNHKIWLANRMKVKGKIVSKGKGSSYKALDEMKRSDRVYKADKFKWKSEPNVPNTPYTIKSITRRLANKKHGLPEFSYLY